MSERSSSVTDASQFPLTQLRLGSPFRLTKPAQPSPARAEGFVGALQVPLPSVGEGGARDSGRVRGS